MRRGTRAHDKDAESDVEPLISGAKRENITKAGDTCRNVLVTICLIGVWISMVTYLHFHFAYLFTQMYTPFLSRDLNYNMDHMRISDTEPSSVIPRQTKWLKKYLCFCLNCSCLNSIKIVKLIRLFVCSPKLVFELFIGITFDYALFDSGSLMRVKYPKWHMIYIIDSIRF